MGTENLAPTRISFPEHQAYSMLLTNYALPDNTVVYKSLHFSGIGRTTITMVLCMFIGCHANASMKMSRNIPPSLIRTFPYLSAVPMSSHAETSLIEKK
jgi:hypothetical protein